MAKQVDIRIEGLNALLKDLRKLPKDATVELRRASVDIATRHMLPSWRAAALTAGDWGPKLADSIRVRSDRLPALLIGSYPKDGPGLPVADQLTVFDAAFKAVGDFNTEALTITEVVLDLLSQVGDVHHDFGEAVLPQQLQQKLHHWFLQDGNHRLGNRVRNGTHPCSLASSQDHRLHGHSLDGPIKPPSPVPPPQGVALKADEGFLQS